jgi:hypothetical protein
LGVWRVRVSGTALKAPTRGGRAEVLRHRWENHMNIFYIIGVVVVVLFVLGYFGLR